MEVEEKGEKMKEKLINEILKTGRQVPEKELRELDLESLEFILTLRKEYAK